MLDGEDLMRLWFQRAGAGGSHVGVLGSREAASPSSKTGTLLITQNNRWFGIKTASGALRIIAIGKLSGYERTV